MRAIEVPHADAVELAKGLDQIDLRADRCPRNAAGQCVMFVDGGGFHVEVRGHPPVDIFDLGHERGYVSENPQLSEWIYKLLDVTKQEKKNAPR